MAKEVGNGPASALLSATKTPQILFWIAVWYGFSAWATFLNKTLLRGANVFPITLTFYHLLTSVFYDGLILALPLGVSTFKPTTASEAFRVVGPVAFGMVFNKMLTYLSYGLVPVSLTHTIKASSPVFAVAAAYLVMGRRFNVAVYASLVPIVVGVCVASISEIEYNHSGFACALLSSVVNVAQNLYAKQVMASGPFDEWNMHLYVGAVAVAVLAPFVIALETVAAEQASPTPWLAVFACCTLQYVASIASYLVLSLVADITFTIANVMKRLFIIGAYILYFGREVTLPNAVGMAIAIAGAAAYDFAKRLPQPASVKRIRGSGLPSVASSSSLLPFARRDARSPPTDTADSSARRAPSPALLLRRAALWLRARVGAIAQPPPPASASSAFHAVRRRAQPSGLASRRALRAVMGASSPSDGLAGGTPTPSWSSGGRSTAGSLGSRTPMLPSLATLSDASDVSDEGDCEHGAPSPASDSALGLSLGSHPAAAAPVPPTPPAHDVAHPHPRHVAAPPVLRYSSAPGHHSTTAHRQASFAAAAAATGSGDGSGGGGGSGGEAVLLAVPPTGDTRKAEEATSEALSPRPVMARAAGGSLQDRRAHRSVPARHGDGGGPPSKVLSPQSGHSSDGSCASGDRAVSDAGYSRESGSRGLALPQ